MFTCMQDLDGKHVCVCHACNKQDSHLSTIVVIVLQEKRPILEGSITFIQLK